MGYEEERDRSGHRRSRRAKPSEMEDDGLTLITDSFTERREDGSHRSGDRSRSGQKAAKRGQTQPGSSRESRNQEKTRTMNRSDIYADPVKLKARRKKKRKIWFILLEIAVLIGILCFAGYSYISSRLDLMQRLPWNPDEIKNVEISEEKQEQMSVIGRSRFSAWIAVTHRSERATTRMSIFSATSIREPVRYVWFRCTGIHI